MMEHECYQEGVIGSMKTDISNIKSNQEKTDNKVDKIIWFLLGGTFTTIITLIGVVIK